MKPMFVLFCLLLVVSPPTQATPPLSPTESRPGGDTTTPVKANFLNPLDNLSLIRQETFFIGRSFFRNPWVTAPTITTDRDGLGPLFNMHACLACHAGGGRGLPPLSDGLARNSMLFRLSIPEPGAHGARKPEPVYGDQIQVLGISLTQHQGMAKRGVDDKILGEARVEVRYETVPGQYADGEPWTLLKPTYRFTELSYGPMREDVVFSPRVAQQLVGLGLLEAIPDNDILRGADPDDQDQDGISGRANRVWDVKNQRMALGRFGHKANQPTVLQQTAAAFRGDIGITNSLFPEENCMPAQRCERVISGADPQTGVEIPDKLLEPVAFFVKGLGVPARRDADDPNIRQGRALFHQTGCAACHTPSHTTGLDPEFPELSGQTLWPYTDLLLHDLGEGLADGRPDFAASGREWRTPPLWGVGLTEKVSGVARLLHDGRARGVAEAILWHGGEAQSARMAFLQLDHAARAALVAFVNDL